MVCWIQRKIMTWFDVSVFVVSQFKKSLKGISAYSVQNYETLLNHWNKNARNGINWAPRRDAHRLSLWICSSQMSVASQPVRVTACPWSGSPSCAALGALVVWEPVFGSEGVWLTPAEAMGDVSLQVRVGAPLYFACQNKTCSLNSMLGEMS